ncbi:MAG: acetate--CoA ligase family protein [Candidatus Thorarchaeota archaeon]
MNLDLEPFFNPEAIALVGASPKLSSWGFLVALNIIQNNYTGQFFPVHPTAKEVFGYTVYPTILEIPPDVRLDLVIIIIPARFVLSILEQCHARKVKHVVIITGGFRETGEAGRLLEKQIGTYARKHNIRLIGPNGMGIVSTRVNLNAVMWPVYGLRKGVMSFISQSGNIGTIGISVASRRGIGLNTYVSAGNMADLVMSDFLEYFGLHDDKTKILGFYVEGIRDSRRFVRLVRKVSKKKPIILLKAGGTPAGKRAALSHTGAISGDDWVFKNILESAGAIMVDSLEEMFDLVLAFSKWIGPQWKFSKGKVVILTRGGGWGVMASDACSRHGIILEQLNERIIKRINEILPPFWSHGNPIDTVASLDLSNVVDIIRGIFEEMPEVEAVLLLGVGSFSYLASLAMDSPLVPDEHKPSLEMIGELETSMFKSILELSEKYTRPVLITTLLSGINSPAVRYLESHDYPVFATPERMVRAFRRLVNYYNYCQNTS